MDLQEDSVGQRLSFGMIRRQAYEALAANELVRAEELLHLALTADPTQETIQYSVGVSDFLNNAIRQRCSEAAQAVLDFFFFF